MRRQRRSSSGASTRAAAPISEAVSVIHSFNSATNPNRPVRPSPLASSQIQGMPLDLIDRIRSFPLFQSTPDSFLAEVGLHLRPQLHSPNDYIVTEGDEAKAMYWLVRGAVSVTSRDGESIHAELKPGAFFGEIGVLMDRPRTATIIARTRCLLVVLTKENFRKILPRFPEVERAIRDEAQERLMILEKKKDRYDEASKAGAPHRRGSKRVRDSVSGDLSPGGKVDSTYKKRKSPSPGVGEVAPSSVLANGMINIRLLLKELPLFSGLPSDLLHFLGLNFQPLSYPPFTEIIRQDTLGREIYFIVRGEVEVLNENPDTGYPRRGSDDQGGRSVEVKARLGSGQYFGEIVSLSLTPRRTATVRSVTSVECLMLSGEVLVEFWEKCPEDIRKQIEKTAKSRLESATDGDVLMTDAAGPTSLTHLAVDDRFKITNARRKSMPMVTLTESELDPSHKAGGLAEFPVLRPSDPDPFLNVGLDNVRLKSRRGSVGVIPPEELSGGEDSRQSTPVEPRPGSSFRAVTPDIATVPKSRSLLQRAKTDNRGYLPDNVLVRIFQYMELHHLLRLRTVSVHWSEILTKSPKLVQYLDLSHYNRSMTDDVVSTIICPFVKDRPRYIDISNCFHITDEGFTALARTCGHNVKAWKMKSVWDVTATAILEMANKATGLQEVDLSNCRKVSDTLLARLVGWVVPASTFAHHSTLAQASRSNIKPTMQTAAGAVYGCPQLRRLTLSYCKHVTDRSMHHIASHAAPRIEQVDLTRCTTITDQGFQYWGNAQFTRLRKLCLADCTYLTDNAIVYLTNAAKQLQELDLVRCLFSFALSRSALGGLILLSPSHSAVHFQTRRPKFSPFSALS
jgi:F-box/leucine-rich repeat protein 7